VAADAKDRSAVDLARALFARLARDRTDLARKLLPILESLEPRRYSPDFACVAWDGAQHSFTPTQARVVAILWAARANGTPDLRQAYLLTESESDADRLLDVFNGHPAWGTMIVPGPARGTYRLAD
jgi:hypothetical protein